MSDLDDKMAAVADTERQRLEGSVSAENEEDEGAVAAESDEGSEGDDEDSEAPSYRETTRFCTWRKHTRDLYKQLIHVDLVWESPPAQFMPYMTARSGLATQTILSGTRTGGQEQNYVQMFNVTLPSDTRVVDNEDCPIYSDITGEMGGYGAGPSQAGFRVERRMLHDGDVLAARYMPANPLLIATSSSDGCQYIFDWSRISLNKFPNDPPRPRAPLPPNELTTDATDEERSQFHQRMRALNAVVSQQDRWDQRTGSGQQVLKLQGGRGVSECVEWSTIGDGILASASKGVVCAWQVGNLSKEDDRVVQPLWSCTSENEEVVFHDLSFSWSEPTTFACGGNTGSVYFCDMRVANSMTEIFQMGDGGTGVHRVALSPHDGVSLLCGMEDGTVCHFDLRNSTDPVSLCHAHDGPVTAVQWCPHSPHLFATGGKDGLCTIYNTARATTLFKHSAHTDIITDLCWSWQESFAGQLLSADPNALTVWTPRDVFYVA